MALVIGILAIVQAFRPVPLAGLLALAAVMLGVVALGRPSWRPVRGTGRGAAIVGVCVGVGVDGKVLSMPKAARLEILLKREARWETIALEDSDSNVFHKAMVYGPGSGGPGILNLGGS